MPKIYASNEEHNFNQGELIFVNGVAAAASDADVSYFGEAGYGIDNTAHVLSELDKLPKATLIAIAEEMELELPAVIKKRYLVQALYAALGTATATDFTGFTVTYANGDVSATGVAPTETAKGTGETFAAKANTFTLTGKVFAGWKDAGNNVYAAGGTVTMGTANMTLTAQWVDAG